MLRGGRSGAWLLAWVLQWALAPAAWASASFDPVSGWVTLGSIVVGDTEYQGVVLEFDRVLSFSTAAPSTDVDHYDPGSGLLTLAAITVAGTTYSEVVLTIARVHAVAQAWPLTPGSVLPADPLFGDQWHLRNIGQRARTGVAGRVGEDLRAPAAWGLATGAGIQIAVVDDGLDVDHPDLRVAAGRSWDYRSGTWGDPSSASASHGTACAGIAAGRAHNGLGGVGVAFGASVVGYNLLAASNSVNDADAMTRDLAANAIYSNSYGSTDGLGNLQSAEPLWQAALETGLAQGRGGRGAIYTWAAGNGAPADRSDFDGQANFHGVLAVASVNHQGSASVYSEAGANLLISAYGGEYCSSHAITTTDVRGAGGFNDGVHRAQDYAGLDGAYTRCMNGTSAAAPQIAGVAALLLQARPELSWRDVRLLLARTARRNDPTHPDWQPNGAGLMVNHAYGYGVADAHAAVTAAATWTPVPPQQSIQVFHGQKQAIADAGAALESTLDVDDDHIQKLEFVDLTLHSDHAEFGDLDITLTSPSGTTSTVALAHDCRNNYGAVEPCGASLQSGFRFGIARLIGEAARGRWTLRVQDRRAGHSGSLSSWNLRLRGT